MKTTMSLSAIVLLCLLWSLPAAAFPPSQMKGKSCADCHTLGTQEAGKLLQGGVDRVISTATSPVQGLWEVVAEKGSQKFVLYIDFSKEHVFTGNLIRISDHKNLTGERLAELNLVDTSKIPLDDALVLGKKDAATKVIVFTDPQCPFCKKLHHELKEVVRTNPDVAFLIKMYPLRMHPEAYTISKSVICSKSMEMLEESFAGKSVPPPLCNTTAVDENIALAKELGINSTPVLVLPNGMVLPGFKTAKEILSYLDKSGSQK